MLQDKVPIWPWLGHAWQPNHQQQACLRGCPWERGQNVCRRSEQLGRKDVWSSNLCPCSHSARLPQPQRELWFHTYMHASNFTVHRNILQAASRRAFPLKDSARVICHQRKAHLKAKLSNTRPRNMFQAVKLCQSICYILSAVPRSTHGCTHHWCKPDPNSTESQKGLDNRSHLIQKLSGGGTSTTKGLSIIELVQVHGTKGFSIKCRKYTCHEREIAAADL